MDKTRETEIRPFTIFNEIDIAANKFFNLIDVLQILTDAFKLDEPVNVEDEKELFAQGFDLIMHKDQIHNVIWLTQDIIYDFREDLRAIDRKYFQKESPEATTETTK